MNSKSWKHIINSILQTTYIFEHCKTQQSKNTFFLIIFENLSIELLSLLKILETQQPFVKVKRAENIKINNDLETNFQLNLSSSKAKLSESTLCLLIATNPRYEGFYLNLNLRQRFFKGNFKCFMLGSIIDLTFPVSFIGSNLSVLKTIVEGNNLLCQEFKTVSKPLVIYNYEMLKRNDNSKEMVKILKYANIFNKIWAGKNVLSPSISETGIQSLNNFQTLSLNDLNNFNSLYLINISVNNLTNFNKLTELQILNYSSKGSMSNMLFLNQSKESDFKINSLFSEKSQLLHLPSTTFYENEETFINTEGFIKRTQKLIFKKKAKNNWQILRKILNSFNSKISINKNELINYNITKLLNFKNYTYFHYQAAQSLTNLNFYLNIKNESFTILNNKFKQKRLKTKLTKLKYWLDDFFNGGKDEYSNKSLVLANCSKILRTKSTNFF